jgi:hypothetical protein
LSFVSQQRHFLSGKKKKKWEQSRLRQTTLTLTLSQEKVLASC